METALFESKAAGARDSATAWGSVFCVVAMLCAAAPPAGGGISVREI